MGERESYALATGERPGSPVARQSTIETPVSSSELVKQCVIQHRCHPKYLARCEPIYLSRLDKIAREMLPKQCYTNSVTACVRLGGESVIFGYYFPHGVALAIEHAWVKLSDGSECDPTYQVNIGDWSERPGSYIKLLEVPLNQYLAFSKKVGTPEGMGITMLDIRRSPSTAHLFIR